MTTLERRYSEQWALGKAIEHARLSPCDKSKRGVIAWHPLTGHWCKGYNAPPAEFPCQGKSVCREMCRDLAIHAEECAMFGFMMIHKNVGREQVELIHIKVVDDQPVYSGPPSCLRCSAKLLQFDFAGIWLYHETGLRYYPALEFHRLTLEYYGVAARELDL